jgi:putative membrane protein
MTETVLSFLPSLNAGLNLTSALLLILGFVFIRQGAWTGHALCMCSALGTSTVFLISYLVYHYFHGSTPFPGQGWIRPLYFAILISHTVLAALVPPHAVTSLYLALKSRIEKQHRLARVAFPNRLYVSVTGVVIYWMLYRIY